MSRAHQILSGAIARAKGHAQSDEPWDEQDIIDILLEYIDNQDDINTFASFMHEKADELEGLA